MCGIYNGNANSIKGQILDKKGTKIFIMSFIHSNWNKNVKEHAHLYYVIADQSFCTKFEWNWIFFLRNFASKKCTKLSHGARVSLEVNICLFNCDILNSLNSRQIIPMKMLVKEILSEIRWRLKHMIIFRNFDFENFRNSSIFTAFRDLIN